MARRCFLLAKSMIFRASKRHIIPAHGFGARCVCVCVCDCFLAYLPAMRKEGRCLLLLLLLANRRKWRGRYVLRECTDFLAVACVSGRRDGDGMALIACWVQNTGRHGSSRSHMFLGTG